LQTIATSFSPAKASEPAFEHQDDEGSAFQVRSGAMGSLRIARLRWGEQQRAPAHVEAAAMVFMSVNGAQ
jgi:hypothetical protein